MLNYTDGYEIPKWFGDFGGNICINDTDFARLSHPIEQYEHLLYMIMFGFPELLLYFRS